MKHSSSNSSLNPFESMTTVDDETSLATGPSVVESQDPNHEEGSIPSTPLDVPPLSHATKYPLLMKYESHPVYQALMTRIRRAEKFGTEITLNDQNLYRQFKFDTYKSQSTHTAKGNKPNHSIPSKNYKSTMRNTFKPHLKGKQIPYSHKNHSGRSNQNAKEISEKVKLDMLKRAEKYNIENADTKKLKAWYQSKYRDNL